MAPKQNSPSSKEVKPPRELPKMEPKKPLSEIVGTVFAVLGLAALASSVSQLNLSPVYGSIPAAIYHQKGITFTAMLAYVAKKGFKKSNVTIEPRSWIAPWAYYIPVIQFLLFRYSSDLGPLYGPLITEAVTYFPLLFLSFLTTSILLDDFGLSGVGTTISEATPMVISYAAFTAMDTGFKSILPDMMGTSDFFSRSGLQLLIATLSAVLSKSSLLFFAIPAVLHTLFTNPHNYAVGTTRILNQTLAEYRYSILDRHDSNTGYISVVENLKDGYRALRCDHSVLGGEWQITPARAQSGQIVKETIYSVFTMLEAVRMIKSDIVVPDDERDALFIGLGIGTAPKAFIQHGINTTIVEIDPVVHYFATKYFDLPTTHTKVISDAVSWVETQSKEQPESYDYIVHDVFTGGAEPIPLFTLEFLKGLDALLKEDGAIAINYAGDLSLPPPRIILNTIFSVFPTCRIFRDTTPDDPETFLNMVVFCTKSNAPIEFRASRNEDYLNSMARRAFLPPDEGLEIKLPTIGGGTRKWTEADVLKRGEEGEVQKYHQEAALRHWKVMRKVFPDGVWENW